MPLIFLPKEITNIRLQNIFYEDFIFLIQRPVSYIPLNRRLCVKNTTNTEKKDQVLGDTESQCHLVTFQFVKLIFFF